MPWCQFSKKLRTPSIRWKILVLISANCQWWVWQHFLKCFGLEANFHVESNFRKLINEIFRSVWFSSKTFPGFSVEWLSQFSEIRQFPCVPNFVIWEFLEILAERKATSEYEDVPRWMNSACAQMPFYCCIIFHCKSLRARTSLAMQA